MNTVMLIGRLTKDPDVRYSTQTQTAYARFSVAIDRGKDKDGKDRGADYPSVICFGKTAELVEKYLAKGRLVGVQGKIQTNSYEKDGKKYYSTDVLADRVEFLDKAEKKEETASKEEIDDAISMFAQLTDEDIPF